MKKLLLLGAFIPAYLSGQQHPYLSDNASGDPLIFSHTDIITDTLSDTITDTLAVQKNRPADTLNITDKQGRKQGHWIFLGGDFPNSGVASEDMLEQGRYENNERTGIWHRYGPKGEIKAVMRYSPDPVTKTSERDQFYYFTYHSNGAIARKPVIGECFTASDYFLYDENGKLQEAEQFDKECNTTLKLQQIQKGELDSIELLKPAYGFGISADNSEQKVARLSNFNQSGEYCVDYLHRLFQIGTFENGILLEGKEVEVDELMRPQKVWMISGGKIVKVLEK